MNKQNKKFNLSSLLGRSKMRYGTFTAVLIAVVLVAVILINLAVGAIEDKWALSIDLTSTKVTDFSDATRDILRDLDQEIHIYTIISSSASGSNRIKLEEMVNKYRALNSNIKVINIDPVANPTAVAKYAGDAAIGNGDVVVTNADESRVRYITYQDLYTQVTNPITNGTYTVDVAERRITTAIAYVSNESSPRVLYLTGHGEMDGLANITVLNDTLRDSTYDVTTLDLDTDELLYGNGDVVVIIDPQRDMSDEQYEKLRAWMDEGGRLLVSFSMDVKTENLINFTRLLAYYGLSYEEGYIVEDSSASTSWYQQPYYLVPGMSADSEITADMAAASQRLIVPYSRPIAEVEMPESGFVYTKLLTSSSRAVVQSGSETSLPGTKTVALSAMKQYFDSNAQEYDLDKDIRIVLLGSSYLFGDSQLLYMAYNGTFYTNVIDWLSNQQVNLPVYSKGIPDTTLRIPDAATGWTLAALVVLVLPILCLAAGIYVWIKRRRL